MPLPLLPPSVTIPRRSAACRGGAAPPPRARARAPLAPARLADLRRRLWSGEFDTEAHAEALAWALLHGGILHS